MTQQFKLIALVLGLILIVGFDQYTKYLILTTDTFNAMACLNDPRVCGRVELSSVLDFSMVWNRGISFGTLQSTGIFRWLLLAGQGLVAAFFLVWYLTDRRIGYKPLDFELLPLDRRLTAFALVSIISGAIGNLIDRARFGAVVDFIDVSDIGVFPWVFNIADSAVTVGAALLFLDFFLTWRSQQKAGENKDNPIG